MIMKTKAILFISAVALFLSLIPSLTNAQFKKGDMLVEGGLGDIKVSSNKTNYEQNGLPDGKSKSNGFGIEIFPRVGYFISKDVVIGTTLGVGFASSKYQNLNDVTGKKTYESKASATILDVLPFARFYFPGKNVKTRFYGQIGAGISLYISEKQESKNFDNNEVVTNTYKTNYPKKLFAFSGEALVGINHFVSQNVAINAALGYNYSQGKETTTTTQTSGGLTFTSDPVKYTSKTGLFSWNVGFTMFIPCKKKK